MPAGLRQSALPETANRRAADSTGIRRKSGLRFRRVTRIKNARRTSASPNAMRSSLTVFLSLSLFIPQQNKSILLFSLLLSRVLSVSLPDRCTRAAVPVACVRARWKKKRTIRINAPALITLWKTLGFALKLAFSMPRRVLGRD